MKKITIILLFMTIACQNLFTQVRFLQVDPSNNKITLKNFGTTNVDITGNRLCAKFSYVTISNTIIDTGDLSLDANEEVTLNWSIDEAGSDLGYYNDSGSFASAANMLDFTQWGSAGNGRESVAVAKGIWNAGDFINTAPPYQFSGTATQTGVSFWQTVLSVEDSERLDFNMYPNPTNNFVKIQLNSGLDNAIVSILDHLGRELKTHEITLLNQEINIQDLSSGIYFISVKAVGKVSTQQLIKE